MPITLDAFRAKLVIKILYASSIDEVRWYVYSGIKALKRNNVNPATIARFIDKIINQMNFAILPKANPMQWNNINISVILLRREKDVLIKQVPQ